ncbi:MAG TPA: translocation/assembly module TamB domain-containing protein, partial [Flavobacterium sp.]|nr:translocation/assembly module TamB domain-containing protein [Flavobacterium sp.]
LDAGMDDPNLTFTLDAGGGFSGKYPTGKLKLNLDIADLNRLNLHAGPMKLRGEVDADIDDSDPDNLNGRVDLHRIQILKDADPIVLDSISVVALSTADSNSISLKSQFVRAKMKGKYKLTQLPTAVKNTISKYYNVNHGPVQPTDPQVVDFQIRVTDDKMLEKIAPQIAGLEPIDIQGSFRSVSDSLAIMGRIPRLVYGSNQISGVKMDVRTERDSLVYHITVDAVENDQFLLPFTELSGNIKDDVISYRLFIRDRAKKDQYAIAGTLKSIDGETEISLDPDGLLLNYEKWTLSPDNVLRFGKQGIYANNFELSREGSSLKIQSESEAANAPLDVIVSNFKLSTLLNMIRKDELLANGTLNGEATLRDLTGTMSFTSDLTISKLEFQGNPVGDLSIKVNNQTVDTLKADVSLTGNGNQLNINGDYRLSQQAFDLKLDIDRLNIESIQGFTFGNIRDGEGFLSGQMDITGTPTAPRVNGELKFNDVGLRVTQLNSFFKDIDETMTFDAQGILMDSFTVYDQKDNRLIVDGRVLTQDYRDYTFDLTVNAENFRAINSKQKDNDQFFGDLFVDARLDIKGTPQSPVVRGNLKVNEDTKFTVALPQSDPSIADREGIVEFVDEDNQLLQETEMMKSALDQSALKGMDVAVNIETVKEAILSLIVDKGNGDFLELQGEAQLTGGIDPSGKTTLVGKYEFTDGAYEMTFNLIKRRFEIKPGSFLIWNGEPTAANVNLTAIYNVEAPPIDLVGDQLGSVA